MMNSLSDSHLSAYISPSHDFDVLRTPESSIRRFSQLKRKPAPIVPTRYAAAELQDPLSPIWDNKHRVSTEKHILTRPQTPSDDTHDFWNYLTNSDSDTEEKLAPPKVPRRRPRAHTIPSKRFSKLVRVPPPVVDIGLLESTRRSGALRPASAPPEQPVVQVPDAMVPAAGNVNDEEDGAAHLAHPEQTEIEDAPPRSIKSKSFRKSTFSFMQKRKSNLGELSVASISSPVFQSSSRKYSVVSMASNNSMISLSAFPQPPESVPPIPTLPSLELFNPPKLDMQTLRSYVLHADPPLSADAGSVRKSYTESAVDVPSDSRSSIASVERSEDLVPPTTGAAKGKGPPIIVLEHRDGPREPHFDFGEPPELDVFDESRLPNQLELEEAANLPVISESGVRVAFGSLWQDQKTIVCFIRHFWCPLCQDYMFSISRNVSPAVLDEAGIQLVIISNGSHDMIKSYRKIFRTPFALYTDPSHKVYNALGMTLQTMEKGPRGNYVRHGLMSGIGMVVVNAVKVGMPVWKEGGDISQLGGEFILGPGLTCSWVHRMRYTRNHVPILQVIEAAGVDMYTPLHRALSSTGGSFLGMSSEQEVKWMERRRRILKRLRGKKMSRRGGTQWIETVSTATTTTGTTSTSTPSPSSSKRSSARSEPAGASLCSWDPATEEGINVGLTGDEDAIIEEVEEEEAAEAEMEREQQSDSERRVASSHFDEDLSETRSEMAPSEALSDTKSEILSDTKSEYTDSFVSRDPSELESSTTDLESAVAAHPPVEVSFEQGDVDFDGKVDERTISYRSSISSIGSGYDIVAKHHDVYFGGEENGLRMRPASMSESSLESMS